MRNRFFSHHEPCPKCRENGQDAKGDNLGVWADGHKWCFKCGYRIDSNNTLSLETVSTKVNNAVIEQEGHNKNNVTSVTLPFDYSIDLSPSAKRWLEQYEITESECHRNRIGWSEAHQSIVFPVFSSMGLIFAQERFLDNPKRKYKTTGKPEDLFHFLGPKTSNLVLVEDAVSAIKVARQFQSMPLWGSSISQDRILRLSRFVDHLIVWLDNDKASYAIRRAVHMKPYFTKVTTIVTEFDPKLYSDEEIKEFINEEIYEPKSGVC